MSRYGRIADPRHICGPSLDPPDENELCTECEEYCHTEGTPTRGTKACACQDWPEDREGEFCPECKNDGQLTCDCLCHHFAAQEPDEGREG